MNNTELYNLLTEAAEVLSRNVDNDDCVLTEAAKDTTEGKKLVNDVKDAIEKKDEKKLRKSLSEFKKWFMTPDPEGKHHKLRDALVIIYALLAAVAGGATFYGTATSAINLAYGENKLKWTLLLVASFSSLLVTFKGIDVINKEADKVQAESIDEFIKKYEKKVDELKKSLEKFEGDKTSKEYKAIAKSYKEAVLWLDWFKGRKDQITKAKNINDTKQDLKDAKKSKDKQKIAEAKAKYKAAKSLIESALEILGEQESLTESVGVKEKATDKIVKVFKNNAEAADWIANNGGNDMYQLTNRLK